MASLRWPLYSFPLPTITPSSSPPCAFRTTDICKTGRGESLVREQCFRTGVRSVYTDKFRLNTRRESSWQASLGLYGKVTIKHSSSVLQFLYTALPFCGVDWGIFWPTGSAASNEKWEEIPARSQRGSSHLSPLPPPAQECMLRSFPSSEAACDTFKCIWSSPTSLREAQKLLQSTNRGTFDLMLLKASERRWSPEQCSRRISHWKEAVMPLLHSCCLLCVKLPR